MIDLQGKRMVIHHWNQVKESLDLLKEEAMQAEVIGYMDAVIKIVEERIINLKDEYTQLIQERTGIRGK